MQPPVFIGDETSAAGWRLAGLAVCTPQPGDEAAALQQALAGAPLVLLDAAVAAALDDAVLRRSLAQAGALLLVLPDLRGRAPLPDLAASLKNQLGLQP